jgi:hypothetical protein
VAAGVAGAGVGWAVTAGRLGITIAGDEAPIAGAALDDVAAGAGLPQPSAVTRAAPVAARRSVWCVLISSGC